MLKKDKTVPFVHPMGTMKQCLDCVNDGLGLSRLIVERTGLREGQVKSALYNLTFIGAIKRAADRQGRMGYVVPGAAVEVTTQCWNRAASVFHPRV